MQLDTNIVLLKTADLEGPLGPSSIQGDDSCPSQTNGKPSTRANLTGQSETAAAVSPKTVAATTAPDANLPPLPKSWADIRAGSLVIGHEGHDYGWWEAIVTEVRGDVLTLRWRDYPKQAAVTRDRQEVALLFAGD